MTRYYGPCMCGATDCPSCGPAQGYRVVKQWNSRRHCFEYVNPDEDDEEQSLEEPDIEERNDDQA